MWHALHVRRLVHPAANMGQRPLERVTFNDDVGRRLHGIEELVGVLIPADGPQRSRHAAGNNTVTALEQSPADST
jgi:hypothetical protein